MDAADLYKTCDTSWELNKMLLIKARKKLDPSLTSIPLVTSINGATITTHAALRFSVGTPNVLSMAKGGFSLVVLDPTKIDKVEKTTLGRMFRKVVKDTVRDDMIRSLSEKLKAELDAAYFQKFIKFPDSVESYYEMFNMKNGSCLQVDSDYYGPIVKAHWQAMGKTHKVHPGVFLFYAPDLQGVYMVNDAGATVARCVLLLEKGVPVAMDLPKGIGEHPEILSTLLQLNTVKPSNTYDPYAWSTPTPFTMHGFRLPGDAELYFPWPTLDTPVNMAGFYTAYDPDTETLRVATTPNHAYFEGRPSRRMESAYDHRGFVKASLYANAGKIKEAVRPRAA